MSIELYAVFVLASLLLVVTPGPNVAMIVGTSLRYGAGGGLTTVAGVGAGLMLQLAAVAAGLSWLVELFARHFDLIRYAGAAYLAILGLQQLLSKPAPAGDVPPALSHERAFGRGFAVAFANPKTFIFFAAFLPQFVPAGDGGARVLWLLAATYAVLAIAGDAIWALTAARVRVLVSGRAQRIADRTSGAIMLGGAALLLAAGRPLAR